ncbi:MAG: integration host factor [Firmicutes bacterium]|jgi:hypothetical protein|nr:integration host factor [Bacillota bacterium]
MALPKLTPAEKMDALKKAQEVRSKRSQMRAKLKSGELTLEKVLAAAKDDEVVARMKVAYLLESLPRIGRIRSRKLMEDIGIDESRRVQGLGVRQKEALLERLAK